MAEWSKAPDSSSGLRKRAWVQIPLLTSSFCYLTCLKVHKSIYLHIYIFLIISYPDTKFDVFMSPIIINFDLYNLNFIVFFF